MPNLGRIEEALALVEGTYLERLSAIDDGLFGGVE